jgi:hypothetical protein
MLNMSNFKIQLVLTLNSIRSFLSFLDHLPNSSIIPQQALVFDQQHLFY